MKPNVDPTPEERELARFFAVSSLAGEHFQDYLLAVRMKDGGYAYRVSDKNWGIGAAQRIVHDAKTKDDIVNWGEAHGG